MKIAFDQNDVIKVEFTKVEERSLCYTARICRRLGERLRDEEATEAADMLLDLIEKYLPGASG
jgi:hypothetical protein